MDVREKVSNGNRLIDANSLQMVLLPITSALEHEYRSLGGAVSGVIKHIDSAPTIDAVPVIRCRECTEFDETEHECSHWYGFRENDFCSYGERKEGAD